MSFTRAVLLGGLDAPTGGQAQANPHPVLLRLDDNAMLPNRFRGRGARVLRDRRRLWRHQQRARLHPHRAAVLRAPRRQRRSRSKIKGSIFDETGKVGVRGRLVTKQGQVLANALLAGVDQRHRLRLPDQYTHVLHLDLRQVATTDPSKAFEAGLGSGVGRAMDRLAQYYISLAEKTFPMIEVDAGRSVDVVLTEGVVIDAPLASGADSARPTGDATRNRGQRYNQDGPR